MKKKFRISSSEKTKYVMSTDADFEILSKIKRLEKFNLVKEDQETARFIKTQLEHDWRKPLIKKLDKLLKKYKR